MISVSGHCMHFMFKICQTVADINMSSQFHEFFNQFLAGFVTWSYRATGQARIDYLAPLFDDNTIILKNDDRRFIMLLTEYVPCTYFHKNNKSQLDIPFVLEFRNPISLTVLFALTAKKNPKTFTKNWVSKQIFSVLILTTA